MSQIAMRSAVRLVYPPVLMQGVRMNPRYLSDMNSRILSEEERAIENVYIQKLERERLDKAKRKAEKEKAAAEKTKSEQKPDGEAQAA